MAAKTFLYLVACASTKQSKPTRARDLYCSDWFLKARAYVEGQHAPWLISRAPRFSRALQIPRSLSWSRHHRCRPRILVGSVVVLPALLLSAAGRRTAGASYRGGATAVVLVLLSQRRGLLSNGTYVPRRVDQGPTTHAVGSYQTESLPPPPEPAVMAE